MLEQDYTLGPSWGPPCWEKAVASAAQTAEAHADTVARDQKRKASEPAKQQRKKAKQASYLTDNSMQSRRSYSRHDGGPDAVEAPQDLPCHHLQDLIIAYYKAKIAVNAEKARQIELQTAQHNKDDSSACVWHEYRRLHITSSNVGIIVKRRATTKATPCVRNLLYSKFHGNQATAWGISQEEATADKYIEYKTNNGSPGISINTDCGLVKSPVHPWLAATPDGFVTDPQSMPSKGLVEFKNPYSYNTMKVIDAVKTKKNTFLSITKGKLSLKRTHNCFYQV